MSEVYPAPPRDTVQARFPDGRAFEGPLGTTIEQFVQAAGSPDNGRVVAVLIENRLRELSHELYADVSLRPVSTADSDGTRIYRRSLSFLMIAAAAEIFPQRTITVHHSMPFGGYYCECEPDALTEEELECLRRRMRELVQADLPIRHVKVPLEQALKLFVASNDQEKADLFARRRKDYLTLYELNGVRDYFHGFMVPSTGYLSLFDLRPYSDGFILQFPRRQQPDALQPFEDEPRLVRVFQEYSDWLTVIGATSVAALNRAISSGRIQEHVLVAEALHEQQITNIAGEIVRRHPTVRIVLISGPTSAGKTTFAKRLAVQLLAHGILPVGLNLDDYFVNREDTPRDEHGELDFEAFDALDHVLFQHHLQKLLAGETIERPRFNFYTGEREVGNELRLDPQQILLIEGIHALNPRLTSSIPHDTTYKVTISAFTQLNLDRHNRVPTTDTRMLRRIVRDAAHRGYTASETIRRWPSVRRGERSYIFPFQNEADIFFNSALFYELSVLKPLAQPLLLQVEPGSVERIEANRLLAFLQWFDPLPDTVRIPSNSILREFTGGSIMEAFEPWRR